jgi:ATP-dependent protease ClpP protease subunit
MLTKQCAVTLALLLVAIFTGHAYAENPTPIKPQTYYIIPINGSIGRHFTAEQMEVYLKEAQQLKPAVVVLELDTGGGEIHDAERIVDLIIAHKDLRFVAFVHKALSAGAPITLACEKVYVTESATIGGAVSYSVGKDGMPQQLPADVAEKFQSIWRATCRNAAEHGGHPSLLAEAMVDPAFALTVREDQGKPVFERDGQGKVLKAKGQILTLTAREAVGCTLAEALVPDLKAALQSLGTSAWQQVGTRPGVQPADKVVPEKTGLNTFAAPDRLYEVLYQKVVSLGLTGEQTQIQKTKALEDWKAWLGAQGLKDRHVLWTVTLIQAAEGEMRFVPRASRWITRGITPIPGLGVIRDSSTGWDLDISKADLAGSMMTKKMTVNEFGELLAYVESSLKGATTPKDVQDRKAELSFLLRLKGATQGYPIKVTAKTDNEPRIFLVAWVGQTSKVALTKVAPESEIVLSGKIGEVVPHLSRDGVFLLEIILDQCELQQEPAAAVRR